jgi:hypothetical protein
VQAVRTWAANAAASSDVVIDVSSSRETLRRQIAEDHGFALYKHYPEADAAAFLLIRSPSQESPPRRINQVPGEQRLLDLGGGAHLQRRGGAEPRLVAREVVRLVAADRSQVDAQVARRGRRQRTIGRPGRG